MSMLRLLPGPTAGTCRNLLRKETMRAFTLWSASRNFQTRALQRNPEDSALRNPGRLICPPPLLSLDAVRPWMVVWPPPLQKQLADTQHRRHLIVNFRTTEPKSGNCGNRASTIALLFGQRMDDRTRLSLERFSTQQTLPLVGMGSRCRRITSAQMET